MKSIKIRNNLYQNISEYNHSEKYGLVYDLKTDKFIPINKDKIN